MLGPIRVRDAAGQDLTPDGALQRRLLATLVLHRGRVVTPDAAIEALWPAGAPRDPKPTLQTHLSRLRKRLPGIISSTDAGYRLDAAAVSLDAEVLAVAVAAAAADLHATATDDHLRRFGALYEAWGTYMTDERPAGTAVADLAVHLVAEGLALDQKLAALAAMASQTSDVMAIHGQHFAEMIAEGAFVESSG